MRPPHSAGEDERNSRPGLDVNLRRRRHYGTDSAVNEEAAGRLLGGLLTGKTPPRVVDLWKHTAIGSPLLVAYFKRGCQAGFCVNFIKEPFLKALLTSRRVYRACLDRRPILLFVSCLCAILHLHRVLCVLSAPFLLTCSCSVVSTFLQEL